MDSIVSNLAIGLLNKSVADELSAIHQYMYFHLHLEDQGLGPLAQLFKQTAIIEMGHVETLAERILFLKGEVEMAPSTPVEKITDPAAMLAKAIEMEKASANDYNRAGQECGARADAGSKQIFEELVGDEEAHQGRFEKQLESIQRFGPAYLALQSFGNVDPSNPGA